MPVSSTSSSAATATASAAAFDALYEHRYAHHSPDEPVEMVNIRLAMIGKRPKLSFPRLAKASERGRRRQREVYFTDTARRCAARCTSRDARRRREIAGPAIIQEHGTTTVLFEQDACSVAPSAS